MSKHQIEQIHQRLLALEEDQAHVPVRLGAPPVGVQIGFYYTFPDSSDNYPTTGTLAPAVYFGYKCDTTPMVPLDNGDITDFAFAPNITQVGNYFYNVGTAWIPKETYVPVWQDTYGFRFTKYNGPQDAAGGVAFTVPCSHCAPCFSPDDNQLTDGCGQFDPSATWWQFAFGGNVLLTWQDGCTWTSQPSPSGCGSCDDVTWTLDASGDPVTLSGTICGIDLVFQCPADEWSGICGNYMTAMQTEKFIGTCDIQACATCVVPTHVTPTCLQTIFGSDTSFPAEYSFTLSDFTDNDICGTCVPEEGNSSCQNCSALNGDWTIYWNENITGVGGYDGTGWFFQGGDCMCCHYYDGTPLLPVNPQLVMHCMTEDTAYAGAPPGLMFVLIVQGTADEDVLVQQEYFISADDVMAAGVNGPFTLNAIDLSEWTCGISGTLNPPATITMQASSG